MPEAYQGPDSTAMRGSDRGYPPPVRSLRSSRRLLLVAPLLLSCGDEPQAEAPPYFGESTPEELVTEMSLEEKVDQMHGLQLAAIDDLFWVAGNERLGIPELRMVDGPRGVRAGKATAFPVGMARGATWDPELERRVGRAIGLEASAKGANVLLAPTVNILRHPAWGRAQETYGEDTFHIGVMGAAFIEGAQEHVLAMVKHFAANSIEDTRFDVDVTVDERSLREVYLPHFHRAVVEADAASVMSAYNFVNGHHASENEHLLRTILKGEWEFDGFVTSDWVFGTRDTVAAANGGLDIEMPAAVYFGQALIDAVNAGDVPESVVDEAVARILRAKTEHASKLPLVLRPELVESEEHVALAREVAIASTVLLKNDGALPLDSGAVGNIVVIGELAAVANLGDTGSSAVTPSRAVTPLDGIRARADGAEVTHIPGPTLTADEEALVAGADVAIVVVGLTTADEGEGLITEGGDRDTLSLRTEQEALVQSVAALSSNTVVVLEGGSAIVVSPFADDVEGLLMTWYPGMEGGAALAEVLFGDASPGGRLPLSIPRAETDLPTFDNESFEVEYGFLHGYRYLDAEGSEPHYPFGFGLDYTTYAYGGLSLSADTLSPEETLTVSVDVTNDGDRRGSEIVQVYVHVEGSAVTRAPRDLRGFQRVTLEAGETKRVAVELRADDLAYWNVEAKRWELEAATYVVEVGSSSRDIRAEESFTVAP